MSAKDNLTQYVGVCGDWFDLLFGWGFCFCLGLVGWFGILGVVLVDFVVVVQDESALYILCSSTSAANTITRKAKLTFSLFQGPS